MSGPIGRLENKPVWLVVGKGAGLPDVRGHRIERVAAFIVQIDIVAFFVQAEDGIRGVAVTGVQTCALPISMTPSLTAVQYRQATTADVPGMAQCRLADPASGVADPRMAAHLDGHHHPQQALPPRVAFVEIGRACVGKECRSRWSPYH